MILTLTLLRFDPVVVSFLYVMMHINIRKVYKYIITLFISKFTTLQYSQVLL